MRYVTKRSFKDFDELAFQQEIRNTSWWNIYESTDVDNAVQLFTTKINSIIDKMAPIKTFQTRNKFCPWLSKETQCLIKERNRAQAELSEKKTDINHKKYKKLRNEVTKKLRNDKQQWKKQKLKNCDNNPGKLWKNILGWLS